MIDYKISNGQIETGNFDALFVSGDEATIQRLRQKFLLWVGEWFLNIDAGIPWREILGEKPEPQVLSTIFRSVIADDPGVDEILEFELDFEGSTRKLKIKWRARLTSGEIAEDEVSLP